MTARIDRLDPAARSLLQVVACAGATFDLAVVSALSGQFVPEIRRLLLPAIQDGILTARSELDALVADEGSPQRRCSFFHDRVQQAAHESMQPDEPTRTHLAIGRLLSDRDGADLLEVTFQLNRGRAALPPLADVKLWLLDGPRGRLPGDVYGKVLAGTNGGVRLGLTSVPPDVSERLGGRLAD